MIHERNTELSHCVHPMLVRKEYSKDIVILMLWIRIRPDPYLFGHKNPNPPHFTEYMGISFEIG